MRSIPRDVNRRDVDRISRTNMQKINTKIVTILNV